MVRLWAQGDLLIERLEDDAVSDDGLDAVKVDSVVVAVGETGNRHMLLGAVRFYRNEDLARDIPDNLYIGHLQVTGVAARLTHEEHAPIMLEQGNYRVRRQRHLEPNDVAILED
jgi:hypothetical protein